MRKPPKRSVSNAMRTSQLNQTTNDERYEHLVPVHLALLEGPGHALLEQSRIAPRQPKRHCDAAERKLRHEDPSPRPIECSSGKEQHRANSHDPEQRLDAIASSHAGSPEQRLGVQ